MTDEIGGYFWLEWRLLLISLEIKTEQVGGYYWPDWRQLLTGLEANTNQNGGYNWSDWRLLLTRLEAIPIRLEAITDKIGGYYWPVWRLLLTILEASGWDWGWPGSQGGGSVKPSRTLTQNKLYSVYGGHGENPLTLQRRNPKTEIYGFKSFHELH